MKFKEMLTNRWMSEKMDGYRTYWNGSKLQSRLGRHLSAPSWFIEGLPKDTPLDGELWMGRGNFQKLSKIVKSKEGDWTDVKYYVFDLPSSPNVYEERVEALKQMTFPPHVHLVEHRECLGTDHLEEYLDTVSKEGGEGVIVRDPQSEYISGRTLSLLKVKESPKG